jgi:hypothetical protein
MFRLPASLLHLNDVQNFARFLNGCGLFFCRNYQQNLFYEVAEGFEICEIDQV